MSEFREWLTKLVASVGDSWRKKRKDLKNDEFHKKTGINKEEWLSKLPENIKGSAEKILETLSDDEGVDESFNPVVMALHEIIPEYPELHWRHLHESIRDRVKEYYAHGQYAEAADQGTKIYAQKTRGCLSLCKKRTMLTVWVAPALFSPDILARRPYFATQAK